MIDHRYPRDQGPHCPLKKAVLPSPVSSWDVGRDGIRPEHRSVGGVIIISAFLAFVSTARCP